MAPRERIPEKLSDATKKRWADRRQQKGQQFIAAIPLAWIGPTFTMTPNATRLALAIWFQSKRSRSKEVSIGAKLLAQFGIGRKVAYRLLGKLELAGMVEVDRKRGRVPRVTVKELGEV